MDILGTDYDTWAGIYDSVYSYVQEDIPFYVDMAKLHGGPVLELGCGTGRVTIPVAGTGTEIVGIDNSRAMLDVARNKVDHLQNLKFIHGDMRDYELGRKFNLITLPFRGFLSLLTIEDQKSTLFNIRRHLSPGRLLIFNIFVPDLDMLVQEGDVQYYQRDVTDPVSGENMIIYHQSTYDNHNQIINGRLIVEKLDSHRCLTQKLYRDFQLRYSYRISEI